MVVNMYFNVASTVSVARTDISYIKKKKSSRRKTYTCTLKLQLL